MPKDDQLLVGGGRTRRVGWETTVIEASESMMLAKPRKERTSEPKGNRVPGNMSLETNKTNV